MNRNIELRQERAKIAAQMSELAGGATLATPEGKEKWAKMDADQEQLRSQIEAIEKSIALTAELRGKGDIENIEPKIGAPSVDETKDRETRYTKAYDKYLRYGDGRSSGLSTEDFNTLREHRTGPLLEGTPSGGAYPGTTTGFFVPVGFTDSIETAMKYYGPMLNGGTNDPTIITTATGQPLPFPTVNDTATVGSLVAEGVLVSSNTLSISQIMFGSYKYTSNMIQVSIELLQDSAFDLNSYLADRFAERIGRILNTHFTTGVGTTQPMGILTASTAGPTAVGDLANNGTGAANTIGTNDLIALEHSVDPLYRRGAKFMFHDSTLAALRQILDKYGRPIWQPSLAAGNPDQISGYEYLINNDMPALQSIASSPVVSDSTVLFGQFPKYTIRRVKEIAVLRLEERDAPYGLVDFLAFARYDGNLLDAGTHPVKYLVNTY